ncbi:putative membrane-associated, metal-dependent hydrolase, partial [Xanthomonas hortorum ATCC 19865]
CKTADLGSCSRQDIVNAYDNSIGYTAMIYVSDHGESLGEKGLYLHGVPYAIAPKEQTHVPMVMWFSPEFARDRGLDETCLRQFPSRNR